jgi:hypothetical protein
VCVTARPPDVPGLPCRRPEDIARHAAALWAGRGGTQGRPWAVLRGGGGWHAGFRDALAGGDAGPLIAELKAHGFRVAAEATGLGQEPTTAPDWLSVSTLSAWSAAPPVRLCGDEIRVHWLDGPGPPDDMGSLARLSFRHFFLCALSPRARADAEAYCLANPSWRLCPSSARD